MWRSCLVALKDAMREVMVAAGTMGTRTQPPIQRTFGQALWWVPEHDVNH